MSSDNFNPNTSAPVVPSSLPEALRAKLEDAGLKEQVSPVKGRVESGMVTSGKTLIAGRPVDAPTGPIVIAPPPRAPIELLFDDNDPPGTRYFMVRSGVCNIPMENGQEIEFIHGLYKTDDEEEQDILDYLVKRRDVVEILPPSEDK